MFGNEVAPRFDLATEILIARPDGETDEERDKIIVLPQASAEKLCHQILAEGVQVLICGGIEEEFYHYLIWKKVEVLDSVIGPYKTALEAYYQGTLKPGTIFRN